MNLNDLSNPYHIQVSQSPNSIVDAWSISYIPFDLRAVWQKKFRQSLLQAVNGLVGHKHSVLHGIYEFTGTNKSDIENVLFYNIDQSYFGTLPLYGLRWERGYRLSKTCPITLRQPHHHHYTYQFVQQSHPLLHWRIGAILARWWTTLSSIKLLEHSSYLWHFLKSSSQPTLMSKPQQIRNFGIRVFIDVPKQVNQRFLLSKTKAIIDGLINTLNYHDGTDEGEISYRLSRKIGVSSHEIAKLLRVQEGTLFGKNKLVKLWSNTVQWNPQDDRCLVGEILIRPNEKETDVILIGEIFEIYPVTI